MFNMRLAPMAIPALDSGLFWLTCKVQHPEDLDEPCGIPHHVGQGAVHHNVPQGNEDAQGTGVHAAQETSKAATEAYSQCSVQCTTFKLLTMCFDCGRVGAKLGSILGKALQGFPSRRTVKQHPARH